jgi:TolB-like protein/Flp pilus assembly protein TadD
VLDFGLARISGILSAASNIATDRATDPGTILGTVGYMSPEQVRGETAGPTSDIFSLGGVLFEMIGGAAPFRSSTSAETMAAILREDPPELASKVRGMPPELAGIIGHCLEKNPEERFQSARDLAFDLRAIASASGMGKASAQSSGIDSIAVLPFENATADPDAEYLSDGITETIISKLSRLPQLRVMARSTMFRFKGKDTDPQEVGQKLNVRSVLAGRLAQRGGTLTIWTELVNVSDGSQLWSERYQRKLTDLLSIEEEIAKEVSEKLRIRLSGEEQKELARPDTRDNLAYQAYLRGRYHWSKRSESGIRRGVDCFSEALEKDPTYALAWVGLADSYNALGFYSVLPPGEAFPRAEAAAQRALELNDSLAEAYTSLAYPTSIYRWDSERGEELYRRSLELDDKYPVAHYWYGWFLIGRGRLEEAAAQTRRSVDLDPLSPLITAGSGWHAFLRGEIDFAIEQLQKTLALEQNFALAHIWISSAYRVKGLLDDAIAAAEKGLTLTDMKPIALEALGSAYAAAGRREKALEILSELERVSQGRYLQPYYLASIHAALGEHDEAFHWLNVGLKQHSHFMVMLSSDPAFSALRPDPRFQEIVQAVRKTG